VKIHASLNKQMFFPDEKVIVNIQIDNSRSERDIKDIQCTLTHNIVIRKADEILQESHFDLQLL
jgi:sporulation-control protein spo0M